MIIYDKNISINDIEKLEGIIDLDNVTEETSIIIEGVAYVVIEEGEGNFILKKMRIL